MKKSSSDTAKSVRTVFEHLMLHQDPLAGLILKGHLLVEQLLTELLATRVFRNPGSLEKTDLRFAQLLDLCRAWAPKEEVRPLWELIGKVNTLRNDLGHKLDTPKRRPLLDDIRHGYGLLVRKTSLASLPVDSSTEDLLVATFVMLCGTLLAMTHPDSPVPDVDAIFADLMNS